MDKIIFNEREKYCPLLIKGQKKKENIKKNIDSEIKSPNKNMDKLIYFLSDQKERNSFTFFKTFIGNTDDLSNDILNKKIIKVKTDKKSKSKNNIYNASCLSNSIKRTNPKIKSKFVKKEEDISMNQINKFESRIDNLMNVINDFEEKFIYSSETERIKEQLNTIMNKDIYKDKINNDKLFKSFNKQDIYNEKSTVKDNANGTMDLSNINNINNINININNNNYENNYFIAPTIKELSRSVINKKQNFGDKKFSANNSIIKKPNLKAKKKISKCNSNDLRNKSIHNYKEKPKLFKLPLDSITSNNYTLKNNRYNNSYKDLQTPLTDRKEKDLEDNRNNEFNDLGNSLKNINKKKNICLKQNKAASSKNEIRRKTFFKKEGNNKANLLKNKKKLIKKNLTPLSAQGNPLINNTVNGGIEFINKNKDKEKSVNGSNELIKLKKKDNSELINYILNKRNIIKGNILTPSNNQYEPINNKDFVNNKKIYYNKKK